MPVTYLEKFPSISEETDKDGKTLLCCVGDEMKTTVIASQYMV